MSAYGRLWWIVVIPLAALGALEMLLVVPPAVAWTTATVGGVISGLCCLAHLSRGGARAAAAGVVARVVCLGAVVGVLTAGLSVLLGGAAALVLLAAICLHPRVVTAVAVRVRRGLGRGTHLGAAPTVVHRPDVPARVPPTGPAAWGSTRPRDGASQTIPTTASFSWPDAAALRVLSTSQLCWGWRVSFAALERAQGRVDHRRWAALVVVRQRYLDEIARRDPAGLARWLYAGARPASDPSRYLLAGRSRPRTLPLPAAVMEPAVVIGTAAEAAPTAATAPAPTDAAGPDA